MSRPKKGTQCYRVLERLQSQKITHCREFGKMQPAIMNYTARLSQLRKRGYIIKNHEKMVNGQKHSWYTLEGKIKDSEKPTRIIESAELHYVSVDAEGNKSIVFSDNTKPKVPKYQFNGVQEYMIQPTLRQALKPTTWVDLVAYLIGFAIPFGLVYSVYIILK